MVERKRLRAAALAVDEPEALSRASPTKWGRPYTPETLRACRSIKRLVEANSPMTCRQVYYRLVVQRVIEKTEADYDKVLRWLKLIRSDRRFLAHHPELKLDWKHIIDGGRELRTTYTCTGIGDALADAANGYKRNLLGAAPDYIEVWVEKEALAETLWRVCREYDVPLMASRGFASLTILNDTAQRIFEARESGKRTVIYQLGDLDWSGQNIPRAMYGSIKEIFAEFADHLSVDFTVERLALTREQVIQYDLPSRPGKSGEKAATELDALEPDDLRALVRNAIERHIPKSLVKTIRAQEAKERHELLKLAARY